MKRFKVSVICQATYWGNIHVPDNFTREEALDYAKKHIDEISISSDLEWIADSDVVDEENSDFEQEEV